MRRALKKVLSVILTITIMLAGLPLEGNGDGILGTIVVEAASYTGADVVEYALQFSGCDYVLGAYGPSQFDCVGLVKYVYAHFGVTLPMGTYSYAGNQALKYGTRITNKYELQAGDVIFYGSAYDTLSHAAIYIGNGKMINAVSPSKGVCINAVDWEMRENYGISEHAFISKPFQFGLRIIGGGGSIPPVTTYVVKNTGVTNITDTTAKINALLSPTAPTGATSEVGFYYGKSPDNMQMKTEALGSGQVKDIWYELGTGKWTPALDKGTTYYYQIYAIVNGVTYKTSIDSFKTTGVSDTTPPTISNVTITNQTRDGYTVNCEAIDSSGVERVCFPTWTWLNDQDDLIADWYNNTAVFTPSGNMYSFDVRVSDHNYEGGGYVTHIYAFDTYGNIEVYPIEVTINRELPLTSFSLSTTSLNLLRNETKNVFVTAYNPSDTTSDKTATWTSEDTSIATVDASGNITAQNEGTTNIVCTIAGIQQKCEVHVSAISVGEFSGWGTSLPQEVLNNRDAYDVEEKKQYRSQTKSETISTDPNLSGWTQYGWYWGEWQACDASVTGNDNREVASDTQYVKTQYKYSHWHKGNYTSPNNTSGYTYEETGWLDSPLTYYGESSVGGAMYKGTSGLGPCGWTTNWYNQTTQDVYNTTYRYRDKIFQYYQWSGWSEWNDTPVATGNNVNAEERTLYRYRELIYPLNVDEFSITNTETSIVTEGNELSFKAVASGGIKPYEYKFVLQNGSEEIVLRDYSQEASFIWTADVVGDVVFVVWAKDAQGETCSKTLNVTVKKRYEPVYYTVIFEANGGSVEVNEKQVEYNTPYGELPTPIRAGYQFEGWYTAINGGTQVTESTLMEYITTQTLYAHWTANEYEVILEANGGSLDLNKINVTYHDAYGILPTPIKMGYTFIGWFTEQEAGASITFENTVEIPQNHTLYARYVPNTYTITFHPNGGRVDTEQKSVVYDLPYGELPVPSIIGGTFLGWFTDIYEGTLVTADDIVKLTADQTLYAHWELVYEATTPTANIPTGSEVEAGTKVALTTETNGAQIYYTTDAGIGMNVSAENGILYEDTIAITENVTIYAVAVKAGYNQSDVLVVSYTVKDESIDWGDITEADRAEMGFATTEDIPQELWVAGVFDCDYTGKVITYSDLHVYNHKTMLRPNVDYTVKYKNNTKAGIATITITGKGNYAGSITKTFNIRPLDLSNANVLDVTVPYNGKVQKGTTTVTYLLNGKTVTLKKGTDFNYIYPGTDSKAEDYDKDAFKEAGTYTVTLVGKGNYTGEVTFTQQITKQFVISKMNLGKIANQKYTGSVIEPKITLKNGKESLTEGVDYTVIYSNNVEVGTATITITGIGEYTGTRTATFKITGTALSKAKVDGFVSSLPWTGEQVKQNVILNYAGTEYLTENTDYTVTYQNNTEVGTATVIFTGKGGYTGSIKKTYKITGLPMSKAVVNGLESSVEYNCGEMTQDNYVLTYTKAGGTVIALQEGTDYTVSYQNNQKAGKATIIFKGINGYTGTLKKNYSITAYDFTDAAGKVRVAAIADQTYTKGGAMPKPLVTYTDEHGTVILVEGKDYTLKYINNKAVASKSASKAPSVTITGKGGFKGSLIAKFDIKGSDISTVTMTASDVVYQKKANICKPSIVLYDADGKKLAAGTDYSKTVIYTYAKDVEVTQVVNKQTIYITRLQGEEVDKKDIIPVGAEITATVTGMKNYAGDGTTPSTQSATFRFVAGNIAKATVKVAAQTYTGKAIEPTKDDITVKTGNVTLEKTDYEIVGYSNNVKKGTAKVTIRGIGNYGGEKTVTFKINSKSMNYTIVYDKNAEDATGTMKVSSLSAGKPLSANTYKRTGYTFVGWNTKADGSGESYSNKEAFYLKGFMWIFGRNVTLYAQWEAK